MSHADKRSPVTDALETLGMIHFKPEARDAIHLAVEPVEPVKAVQDLQPGQRIGIINGEALPAGTKLASGTTVPYHGIVDPFLPEGPKTGQFFWFVMAPRMVHSLRHVWEHSDFRKGS